MRQCSRDAVHMQNTKPTGYNLKIILCDHHKCLPVVLGQATFSVSKCQNIKETTFGFCWNLLATELMVQVPI